MITTEHRRMYNKIFIPCAGTGSRIYPYTKSINKSMVSVGLEPAINKIIAKVPESWEIIIALGYKSDLLREYLNTFYPERHINYVQVEPYEGPGSSLSHTINSCYEYLQSPFVFCSCDTLVIENFAEFCGNWVGVSPSEDCSQYRTIATKGTLAAAINEKGELTSQLAYIGLAGIDDYYLFWKGMRLSYPRTEGEVLGIQYLLHNRKDVYIKQFTWYDTGNLDSYSKANTYFLPDNPPNILDKEDEAIWFIDDSVVKFSTDINFIRGRISRSKFLQPFVPTIIAESDHFYSYQKVEGVVLSECINKPIFLSFLDVCTEFWSSAIHPQKESIFIDTCYDFYVNKTKQRVRQYLNRFNLEDKPETINGIPVPSFDEIFSCVDTTFLCQGIPARMHGDFHFENVLVENKTNKLIFIDWRQSFGQLTEYGDVYYDLAKLMHGLIISHKVIHKDLYSFSRRDGCIMYDFYVPSSLLDCQKLFIDYLRNSGYSVQKVQMLTALVFLNISPLHHEPYCHMLYALGKQMLHSATLKH